MKSKQEEHIDQSYDNPSYPLQEGLMYIKNGKVGEKYVIVDCDKIIELISIGLGNVMVTYPPMYKHELISRHTEVIPYKESEHKHLIKKSIVKEEDEK